MVVFRVQYIIPLSTMNKFAVPCNCGTACRTRKHAKNIPQFFCYPDEDMILPFLLSCTIFKGKSPGCGDVHEKNATCGDVYVESWDSGFNQDSASWMLILCQIVGKMGMKTLPHTPRYQLFP